MSLLGIEVGEARRLSQLLATWPGGIDAIAAEVSSAEALSELSTNTLSTLDEIATDGRIMAHAVTKATDALEAFVIDLDSPLAVAAAVENVRGFNGSDNDRELDRRLAELRDLIEQRMGGEAEEAARVMRSLLAMEQSGDVRFRDLRAIDTAAARQATFCT